MLAEVPLRGLQLLKRTDERGAIVLQASDGFKEWIERKIYERRVWKDIYLT